MVEIRIFFSFKHKTASSSILLHACLKISIIIKINIKKEDVIMQKQMLKLDFFVLIILQDNQVDDLDVPLEMQEFYLIVLQ
jgi:hypothetical protein